MNTPLYDEYKREIVVLDERYKKSNILIEKRKELLLKKINNSLKHKKIGRYQYRRDISELNKKILNLKSINNKNYQIQKKEIDLKFPKMLLDSEREKSLQNRETIIEVREQKVTIKEQKISVTRQKINRSIKIINRQKSGLKDYYKKLQKRESSLETKKAYFAGKIERDKKLLKEERQLISQSIKKERNMTIEWKKRYMSLQVVILEITTVEEALNLFDLSYNFKKEELKSVYRLFAKQYHPDTYIHLNLNRDEIIHFNRIFKMINSAYEILKINF